jgi:hypothetical protein
MGEELRKVQFHFNPYAVDKGLFAVEKAEGGVKRRYLEGVASGLRLDEHGERMTEKCIQSFQRQASAGDVLLYEGRHGVNFIDDIGLLVGSAIDGTGNWHTSFRLYDEADGLGATTLEAADKVWRQSAGMPPYSTPKQRGFSIEGEIPPQGLQTVDALGRRVMDDVTLDGVVLVDRPAYSESIAVAVYKALGLPGPWKVRKNLARSLERKSGEVDERDLYYRHRFQLNDALDSEIVRIMADPDSETEKRGQLETLFSEYASMAIDEVLSRADLFRDTGEPDGGAVASHAIYKDSATRLHVLKQVEAAMYLLVQGKRRSVGRKA